MNNESIQAGYDQMCAVGKTDLVRGIVDVDRVPDISCDGSQHPLHLGVC
ncbi:hypothetical protein GO755_20760 [Spirosoma sp. HMF4905]|uniref:Uncharacterized protein n=1 Tax=Spirosoma arboris TaxID=2682092 RepID=A0A7K1SFZ5_9BACT|nr:hypothetical protein [Spirosoma arboris]MVM32486.1 hypothetical protein [Spirosoma arboris]